MENEFNHLKNEISELKENIKILRWNNFLIDSKIINGNENYMKGLKLWINSSKNIKTELLYRLSENGDNIQHFIYYATIKVQH